MRFKFLNYCLFLVVIIGASACNANQSITIHNTDGQKIDFSVEIAKTLEEQAKGLMFVEKMPEDKGMIFIYDAPQVSRFWMKNTLIPLDMLFFDSTNTLVHIEHSATPHDETPRGPLTPICSVVEIKGGLAKKMDIRVGAKIITNLTQECLQSSMK
jgi:uncharacterized membrane protein (UPF0127 family)